MRCGHATHLYTDLRRRNTLPLFASTPNDSLLVAKSIDEKCLRQSLVINAGTPLRAMVLDFVASHLRTIRVDYVNVNMLALSSLTVKPV